MSRRDERLAAWVGFVVGMTMVIGSPIALWFGWPSPFGIVADISIGALLALASIALMSLSYDDHY